MKQLPQKIGVAGAGAFGRNHLRVLATMPEAQLMGFYDANPAHAAAVAAETGLAAFESLEALAAVCDAAVIAVPTVAHAEVGCQLMEAGLDILVEKPIAADLASAQLLVEAAERLGRILQVGHLERFNPAIAALEQAITLPLFFEIHRMSVFTPRSLDVDVVLDLMIHDIEILLALTKRLPTDIKAAGIHIMSQKVDIANVRLEFEGGCIANLTASRASTEKVRKMRVFQPGAYFSLDYAKQELFAIHIGAQRQVRLQPHAIPKEEPLRLELAAFIQSIETRAKPKVDGPASIQALRVALAIMDKIELHAEIVSSALKDAGYPAF